MRAKARGTGASSTAINMGSTGGAMTDHQTRQQGHASFAAPGKAPKAAILGRFAGQFAQSSVSFNVTLPDGTVQRFGPGVPSFHVSLKNARALRAIASVDEGRLGDAYLAGDLDLDGDML